MIVSLYLRLLLFLSKYENLRIFFNPTFSFYYIFYLLYIYKIILIKKKVKWDYNKIGFQKFRGYPR